MNLNESLTFILTNIFNLEFIFKIGFILFSVVYFIFSLIVIRQIFLMTDTLITEVSPILRAIAILHALLALAVVVFFIGLI